MAACLHFTACGDSNKPHVLFLHGFMGRGRDWETVVAGLADAFRCVTVDLPGHGDTRDSEPYSMQATAGRLASLMDSLHCRACSIVGYSMGGRLALYFALHYPHLVRRLVLESASPGLRTESERAARRDHDKALAQALERDPFDDFLRRWYDQPLFESLRRHPQTREALIAARRDNDPLELARSLREMGLGSQPSLWERLPELSTGTLLIVGESDTKFREIAAETAALSPALRVETVPGCGHNVHDENPAEYTRLVKDFLAGN
jgi:2-succinyl-6-hydroxy-2,4-cyclohexadiene-1-carboxylate synthase